MADLSQAPCPAATVEVFTGLLAGELSLAARAVYFVHVQGCGACQQRLLEEAPELLLAAAAENFSAPEPLDLPRLMARLPERSALPHLPRAQVWQIAAMLLILLGGGALLFRRHSNLESRMANLETSRSAPTEFAENPAGLAPEPAAASVESGADDFQIHEYEAPGFDGITVQWIRMTPEEMPAAAGEARS